MTRERRRGEAQAGEADNGGASARVLVRSARAAELAARIPEKIPPDMSRFLLSPMPNLVASLSVAPGRAVKAGELICVVDAMKMENAPSATELMSRQGIRCGSTRSS